MADHPVLVLTEAEIRAVLTYQDLIPAMRRALADLSGDRSAGFSEARRVLQPVRTVLPVVAHAGWFATMPAVYGNVMGAKMVTFYPGNDALGIHTHFATIQLFRAATGEPLAFMDGRLITEMRTAAVSAAAADILLPPGPVTVAILGSGVQARSHHAALSTLRQLREVRIWSRTSQHAERLATEIGARAMHTAEQAVTGADLVITVTSSPTPVLFGKWLRPDAVVCAVGASTPDRRELDADAMRGPIFVESREAAAREAGDILLAHASITGEIGELFAGVPPPRGQQSGKEGPIVFKSVGVAVEDVAAARLVYNKVSPEPVD